MYKDHEDIENIVFMPPIGEDGEADEIQSYVVMPNDKEHIWVKKRNAVPKGTVHEH